MNCLNAIEQIIFNLIPGDGDMLQEDINDIKTVNPKICTE